MKLRLPRLKKTKGGKSQRSQARGGIVSGVGGLLGGLFSGGSSFSEAPTKSSSGSKNKKSGGANYGPLPSLNARGEKAKKIQSPTLADVSLQLGKILSKVAFVEQTLKDQLELDRFQYKENARLQKEARAESRLDGVVPAVAAAGLDLSSLDEAFARLLKSIDDAANNMDQGGGSGGAGGLPLAGGGGARGGKQKFQASKFVKKTEALNKSGKVKSGYEAVTGKNGNVVGYRKTFKPGKVTGGAGRGAAAGVKSVGKSAMGLIDRVVGSVANKVLTPAIIAYQSYEAWQEINALPKDLSPSEKKNKIAKIVGRLVGQIGLMWAGATLGAMAGTAVVPGPGSLVGFVGGIAGGLTADYFFADDVDSVVNLVVDKVMPVEKERVVKAPKAPKTRLNLTPTPVEEAPASAPVSKPKVTKRNTSGINVSAAIDRAAAKVGVDPYIVKAISKETNPNLNMATDLDSVKGQEVFKLTPEQWTQVIVKYGSTFPELSNGMNDPKAAIAAASLLTRDAQSFLIKNDIPTTPDKLFAAFLVGPEGIESLSRSRPDTPAKNVVPTAASRKPELFSSPDGKPISTSGFLERTFNVSPQKPVQLAAANPPTINTKPATPPVQPKPTSQPQQPTNNEQTKQARPTPPPKDSPSPTPTEEPQAKPVQSNPDKEKTPHTDNSSQIQMAATPVMNVVEAGTAIEKATEQVESLETQEELAVIDSPSSGPGPVIMPSTTPGYTGTGNVPDPTFDLGEINEQLFFRALT